MRTPMHETEHQQTWSCCQWNSVPTLSMYKNMSQQTPRILLHFFVLRSEMCQKYWCLSFLSSEWCFESYCHMMTEGTFRVTPLLACQLVSGDYFAQLCTLCFYYSVWTSRKVTPRICRVDLIYVFLNCVLTVEILWKRDGLHILRI